MSLSRDYYDVLDPYIPERARKVLNKQKAEIEQKIEDQIKGFAEQLGESVSQKIAVEVDLLEKDLNQKLNTIEELLQRQDLSQQEQLAQASAQLVEAVATQRQQVQAYGQRIRTAAELAAKAAGLPI